MSSLKRHPVTDLRQNILGEDYPHMAGAYIVIQNGPDDAGYIREEYAEQWDKMQRSAEAMPDLLNALQRVYAHLRSNADATVEASDLYNVVTAAMAKANP